MSKPEYGTIEYIRAHQQQWWVDSTGQRFFLVGVSPENRLAYEAPTYTSLCIVHNIDDWYEDNIRPESDPAPVKRKVELAEVFVWYAADGSFLYANDKMIEMRKGNHFRHIPATTIEVEA